ncbi:hypothetical protein ACFOQM_01540 [Paenibacillus sp. GCM10012307]|uniref:Uncharacterized protein n=1 Tax=Paenibacillus roseus TaxID=2798579 RepID=A0A934J403_9BACL|nr:hypothetical protein [Paenibacillus roseus]MBJ6360005.1 hypothetical protein [Paenibacillus roseus]
MLQPIASHPYVKIERGVTSNPQDMIVHQRVIELYETKITTCHREFSIGEVHDMSYRKLGKEGGFLYLHTNQGVFPYTVKDNPIALIQAFKQLIDNINI